MTVPPLPAGRATPDYSPVVGTEGSTGSGWPFSDYNIMNDPEGTPASLPPIYDTDGTGGQGGDPFAFATG